MSATNAATATIAPSPVRPFGLSILMVDGRKKGNSRRQTVERHSEEIIMAEIKTKREAEGKGHG